MARKFMMPKTAWLGKDSLQSAEKGICALGKKALIVSGRSMIQQGYMRMLTDILERNSISWEMFSDISGEPTDQMIIKGTQIYKDTKCDFIIGFGGGSPIDSAKAIGVLAVSKSKLSDYLGKDITFPLPPIVAIPTTAGTGSEVTQFSIITDTTTNIKMLLKGNTLIPTLAIIDPEFTIHATENVTVASGLDALTHAIEAYTSKKAYEQSDRYAISAVKKIFNYLPLTLEEPENIEYRNQMSIAAYEAGVSFSNSSVTLVHGMSRPIGALFHIPHGISNAMLLGVCLEYALSGAYNRFADFGRAVGVAKADLSDIEASKSFLQAVKNSCILCKVPTLCEYGIDKRDFVAQIPKMAKDAIASGSPANTRRNITASDIEELYKKLW